MARNPAYSCRDGRYTEIETAPQLSQPQIGGGSMAITRYVMYVPDGRLCPGGPREYLKVMIPAILRRVGALRSLPGTPFTALRCTALVSLCRSFVTTEIISLGLSTRTGTGCGGCRGVSQKAA